MFRNLSKSHLGMTREDAMELLNQGEYAIISALDPSGYPYCFPMSYTVMDGHIYFHGAQTGHKMDCLKHSDKVSFAVIGHARRVPEQLGVDYESIVGFRRAFEVAGSEKENALIALVSKYASGYEDKGQVSIANQFDGTAVIRIEIEHITGKRRKSKQS